MTSNCRLSIALAALSIFLVADGASAQVTDHGRWAAPNDPLARQLIEKERTWATLDCAPRHGIDAATTALVQELIADDFVGTDPKGALYTKADMLPDKRPRSTEPSERDCRLISGRVRFIGLNVAVLYGRESAVIKGADGREATRTLVWTDTFLKRASKWQIVAVQDMVVP